MGEATHDTIEILVTVDDAIGKVRNRIQLRDIKRHSLRFRLAMSMDQCFQSIRTSSSSNDETSFRNESVCQSLTDTCPDVNASEHEATTCLT